MKKRMFSLVLALVIALSLAAVPSLAADASTQTFTNRQSEARDFNTNPGAEAFRPVIVVEDKDVLLETVSLLHWNGGRGAAAGYISVYDNYTHALVGRYASTGRDGNTWWDAAPKLVLKAGNSYCIDCSDRRTWSFGGDSGFDFIYEYTLSPAPVVVEQPVVEQPVVEQPVVEQPVVEQPVVEQPVVEQPVVEQPVVEQPVVAPENARPLYSNAAQATLDYNTKPQAELFRPVFGVSGTNIVVQSLSVPHFNGGAGAAPGTVSLYDAETMQRVGTWQAVGRDGNTWWDVYPGIELEARKSYVIDCSDRATWNYIDGERAVFGYTISGYHLPAPVPPIDLGAYTFPACAVRVNGRELTWSEHTPYINTDSRSMATLTAIAEALGLTVTWDAAKQEAVFTDGVNTLTFAVGSNCAIRGDGSVIHMDTMAAQRDGYAFAPIRCLAESFGWTVEWGDSYKTVYITG